MRTKSIQKYLDKLMGHKPTPFVVCDNDGGDYEDAYNESYCTLDSIDSIQEAICKYPTISTMVTYLFCVFLPFFKVMS